MAEASFLKELSLGEVSHEAGDEVSHPREEGAREVAPKRGLNLNYDSANSRKPSAVGFQLSARQAFFKALDLESFCTLMGALRGSLQRFQYDFMLHQG